MKLLLDQNLSHRLVKSLIETYPDSNQVALLNMGDASDQEIWEYAKTNDYVIATKDADFYEFSVLLGGPPQVIWLKCGNKPKSVVLDMLLSSHEQIEEAYELPTLIAMQFELVSVRSQAAMGCA